MSSSERHPDNSSHLMPAAPAPSKAPQGAPGPGLADSTQPQGEGGKAKRFPEMPWPLDVPIAVKSFSPAKPPPSSKKMHQIYVCSSTLHHPVRWEGFGCIATHQNLLPKSPGTPLSSPDGCWASASTAGSQEPQTPASAARGHGIAPRWVLMHSDLKICFYEHLFTAQLPTPLWEGYNPGDFFQDWKPRSGGNKKSLVVGSAPVDAEHTWCVMHEITTTL